MSLKTKTSSGIDNISSKLLKEIRATIIVPLVTIINKSLTEGIVPDQMKLAKVIPVFKAKDKQMFNNYRPISLLPCISKILEKVIHKRLYNFLTSNEVLYLSQYGFRPKHSTVHAVTELMYNVLTALENDDYTLSVFLDLSKAFDTIDHSILLKKLDFYGIRGVALNWFRSYLLNRQQLVKLNKTESNTMVVTCGVPQGSVLGPLLFIIYTNDLPINIKHAKSILFADDTTLYYSSKCIQDLYHTMNSELDILSDWFKANKLSLNAKKTNYMIFKKQRNLQINTNIDILIDSTILEKSNTVKFLGIYIDDKLTWQDHIEHCRKKMSSGVYALNATKHLLSQSNLKIIYYSLIHPYLTYGILLWGNAYKKHIQKVLILQKKAIRSITNSTYNEHTAPLYKQLMIPILNDIYKIQLGKLIYNWVY